MDNLLTDGRTIRGDIRQFERQHLSTNPVSHLPIAVVVGMPHSGIPLCANLLGVLGYDMADPAPPEAENGEPRWERREIAAAHDRILGQFRRGRNQHPDFPLPARWWADPAVQAVKREMVGFLRDRIDGAPFGFGDARAVRLLPLWAHICRELRLDPKFVVCLRHPAAVAVSLAAAEGAAREAAEYRWLVSYMELFRHLGDAPICLIEYEDWRADPSLNLEKLSQFFGLQQTAGLEFVSAAAASIVDREFADHTQPDGKPRLPAVAEFHRLLRGGASDPEARGKLADRIEHFAGYQQLNRIRFREYEDLADRADDRAELQAIVRSQVECTLEAVVEAKARARRTVMSQLYEAFTSPGGGAAAECLDRFAAFVTGPQRVLDPPSGEAALGGLPTCNWTTPRKLICHIGGPKTGSSALQLFFAHNAHVLKRHGIDYNNFQPIAHDLEVTSGNGVPLTTAILQQESLTNVENVLTKYYDENAVGLVSTEDFSKFGKTEWMAFKQSCEALSIAPKFVMFVRDIFQYTLSDYHQAVKRGGEDKTFIEFILEREHYAAAETLRYLEDIFGKDKCRVLHYDSTKRKLGETFLSAIDLDIDDFDRKHLNTIINRRLTEGELELMLHLNRRFAQFINTAPISDILLYADPDASVRPDEPLEAAISLLEARYRADLLWLNDTFFGGRDTVKLYEPAKPDEAGPAARADRSAPGLSNACWRNLSQWAAERLRNAEEDGVAELEIYFRQHSSGEFFPKWPDKIPADFNPVEYLILNLDVLHAGANAYDHFVEHGLAEGRAYKAGAGG